MLDRLQKLFTSSPSLSSIMERHSSDTGYTPDWPEQMKKKWIPVFSYSPAVEGIKLREYLIETNVKTFHNHMGKLPVFAGYTEDGFYHWQKDLGLESFSVVLEDQISGHHKDKQWMEQTRVWGEVFYIRPTSILKLDFLHENTLQYFRKRVRIIVPNTKVLYSKEAPVPNVNTPVVQVIDCYMYFGNHYYWDQQLGGVLPSSPVPTFTHLKADIGQFSRFKK